MSSKVKVKCKNCKVEFEARIADRKRGWARFCSKSCKALHQEKRTGQYREMLNHDIESQSFIIGAAEDGK